MPGTPDHLVPWWAWKTKRWRMCGTRSLRAQGSRLIHERFIVSGLGKSAAERNKWFRRLSYVQEAAYTRSWLVIEEGCSPPPLAWAAITKQQALGDLNKRDVCLTLPSPGKSKIKVQLIVFLMRSFFPPSEGRLLLLSSPDGVGSPGSLALPRRASALLDKHLNLRTSCKLHHLLGPTFK